MGFQENLGDPLLFKVALCFGPDYLRSRKTETRRQSADWRFVSVLQDLASLYELSPSCVHERSETKFENNVRFARKKLVETGDFEDQPSEWILTEKGWQRLRTFLEKCFRELDDKELLQFLASSEGGSRNGILFDLWEMSTRHSLIEVECPTVHRNGSRY